jgi:hypothetical protein
MRFWILGLFVLSLSLFLCAQEQPAPPADAQQPQAPAAPAPEGTAAPISKDRSEANIDKSLQANVYIGEIFKIDLEKNLMDLTVTAEDGTSETKRLRMDPKVRLFNRGSGLGLKDLKAGTRVRVLYNLAKEGELPVAKRIVVKPPDASNAQAKPRGTGN